MEIHRSRKKRHLNAALSGHLTLHHVAPCWTENVRKKFALDPGLVVTRPTPYEYVGGVGMRMVFDCASAHRMHPSGAQWQQKASRISHCDTRGVRECIRLRVNNQAGDFVDENPARGRLRPGSRLHQQKTLRTSRVWAQNPF